MNQPIPQRWVVISLAGLATAGLQPYGCSWNTTPGFNQLAARSAVWDRALVASDDDLAVLQSLWQSSSAPSAWLQACRQRGRTELILAADGWDVGRASQADAAVRTAPVVTTSSARLAAIADQAGFELCSIIDVPMDSDQAAETVEETALAQLTAVLLDRLDREQRAEDDPRSLLWLHSDFLTRFWDAPRWLSPVDAEEDLGRSEDEEPSDGDANDANDDFQPPPWMPLTLPPHYRVAATDHPDWVTTWMQTYGCQLRLVDELLTLVADRVRAVDDRIGLLVLGTSGMSLGQSGWLGHRAGPLRSPQIQVPVIADLAAGRPLRVPAVVALPDLLGRILPGQPLPSPSHWADWPSEPVFTSSPQVDAAITTDHWFYVRSQRPGAALFLKPDDRDDINDVSSRCPAEMAHFGELPTPDATR